MTVPPQLENADSGTEVGRLLAKCEELVCQFQYDLALKFCEKILLAAPQNVEAMMMKTTILIDMGESEAAQKVLMEAVNIEPDHGGEKYIALAQLSVGEAALGFFRKAIDILSVDSNNDHLLSSLYCSMAEIFMTDLCMQEDAEQKCEELIRAAMQACPESYEALQTMANMKMSQNKTKEALEFLNRSMSLWNSISFDDDEYPSFEFRLVCSRLLVEIGQFGKAKEILEILAQEDDEILELWYLLALSLHALDRFEDAKAALDTAIKLAKMPKNQSPEMIDAIVELREALGLTVEGSEDDCGEHDDSLEDEAVSDDNNMEI